MTRKDLQDALVKELKENILRDVYGKRPSGEEHPVSVFAQDLPVISEDDDDESMYFPYATVRLGDSDTLDDEDVWHQSVYILLGAYDIDEKRQGHLGILTMIERITARFLKEPLLKPGFRCDAKMSTALQDEDTYPYYFGGVELSFALPKIEKEDPYA